MVARVALALSGAGLMLLLTSCRGVITERSLSPSPSPQPFVTISPLSATPLPSLSVSPSPAAWPFAVPTEYAALFDLAGAVYGRDRLIQRVRIPALNLESVVVPVGWQTEADGTVSWDSPGPYVGWALTSALPDEEGNVVLYGHNNIEGSVFLYLYRLQRGDEIVLVTGRGEWRYRVEETRILPVQGEAGERQVYRSYLGESQRPRLTVVSCYPPENNTQRVVVVARPVGLQAEGE